MTITITEGVFSWASIAKRSVVLLVAILLLIAGSCSNHGNTLTPIMPPFEVNDGVKTKEIDRSETTPSGMTGDKQTFIIWSLQASSDQIDKATSDKLIRDKLVWFTGHSDHLDRVLQYFERYEAYKNAKGGLVDVINDPNVRFAFTQLSISSDGKVDYASIWICSTNAKKIAFLSGF